MRIALFSALAAGMLAAGVPALAAGISVHPPSVRLQGAKATQVLVVNAGDRDVTAECNFRVSDAAIASVLKDGLLTAAADGKTLLAVSCREGRASVRVTVTSAGRRPEISFVKDVVPVFTMAGCAGSNCHGSIRGQAGFKLSLFGYEPADDFQAITGGDGHRISRAEPEKSLILAKPTFQMAHGGGMRFPVGSLEYRTILEWIRGGATYDSAGSPRIVSLSVFPEERILSGAGATHQLVATAKYSDGTSRDVTHLVQYSSNNPPPQSEGSHQNRRCKNPARSESAQAGKAALPIRRRPFRLDAHN